MERQKDLLTVVAESLILVAEEIQFTDTAIRVRNALRRHTLGNVEVDVNLSPADRMARIEGTVAEAFERNAPGVW